MSDHRAGEKALAAGPGADASVRVLVAEDCNVTRKMICRLLAKDAEIEVVAQAADGGAVAEEAHALLRDGRPVDVVLLDVEMPVMDGLAVLPLLAMLEPAPRVIMVSALTRRGASISVEAMLGGAADFIAKPAGGSPPLDEFARDLIGKIKALCPREGSPPASPAVAAVTLAPHQQPTVGLGDRPALHPARVPAESRPFDPSRASITGKGTALGIVPARSTAVEARAIQNPGSMPRAEAVPPVAAPARLPPAPKVIFGPHSPWPSSAGRLNQPLPRAARALDPEASIARGAPGANRSSRLRAGWPVQPRDRVPGLDIVAVGSSTGGPQALLRVLQALSPPLSVPLVITQHMQRGFIAILAEQLQRQTGLSVKEAEDGDSVTRGSVLLAPGDRHMLFSVEGDALRVKLSNGPPVHFCRPAVDPMLESLVACGRRALAVILTGMGSDGAIGCRAIIDAGGEVIIQDKASSVVWGMPGAVAARGIKHQELPIDEIGPAIARHCGRAEGFSHAIPG
ncbi:Response regulator receiver domain-containing protein [Arboricoccus pini]|uniref:Protein-glutamate methylesterase/protein-glutamine glutaminase n=1 Tax=Arboricoccus pini TaxID=1963835 RepID=A0A212RU03_9PROT|nr:chemotaxis-specific protein-glutamate methyltransferase CheB [Arboricoccus pini]SNB76110.1 Response regulator receiver domain-containing protein [Arboricoccus pini]